VISSGSETTLLMPPAAFIGGQSAGKMGGSTDKIPVMIAVERVGTRKLGRVRFDIDDATRTHQMLGFAAATIAPGSTIHADGAGFLHGLAHTGYHRRYVSGYNAPDTGEVLSGAHLVALLLKRWIVRQRGTSPDASRLSGRSGV
jgi:hypothetical protein